ncbi:MAG TPA: ATP-binding protein, partial [Allocoleopsis sp.]
ADLIPDVDKIYTSGKHLLELIDGILDLAKIESGRMELYLESFDIQVLLRKLVEQIQPIAAVNHNTLVVRCDDRIGSMTSDLGKVRQILWNLLDNAAKFTHQGTITITAQVQDTEDITSMPLSSLPCIVFRICDTGIGIPIDQQQRIFNIFTQVDESETRKYNGAGLGLTMSQRLCQLLGGSITVTSQENYGSIFSVCLPVKMPSVVQSLDRQAPESQPERRQVSLPGTGRSTEFAASGAAARVLSPQSDLVLVIDDDRSMRDWMVQALNQAGYRVITAWHGGEGLRLARELSPNWIILNMLLSDLDCWAVLSALKDDPALSKIPVILQVAPPLNECSIEPDTLAAHPGVVLGLGDRLAKTNDFKRLVTQLQVLQQR